VANRRRVEAEVTEKLSRVMKKKSSGFSDWSRVSESSLPAEFNLNAPVKFIA